MARIGEAAQGLKPQNQLQSPARSTDLRQATLSRRLPTQGATASPQPASAGTTPAPQPAAPQGIVDPNALASQITPENTLRGQRLGFGVEAQQIQTPEQIAAVQAQQVAPQVQAAFQAQLPQLNQQFADEAEMLAKRTSALGRTGSGQFNKETGFISDRARSAREALLGNLNFQAIQGDAQRALAASQGNQNADLTQQNLGVQIAESNAARTGQVDFARQQHLQGLQAREDALANKALQDRAQQLQFLQQGFAGDPTGAISAATQPILQAGGRFGENAAVLGQQAQGGMEAAIQQLIQSGLLGGGQQMPQDQQVLLNPPGVVA